MSRGAATLFLGLHVALAAALAAPTTAGERKPSEKREAPRRFDRDGDPLPPRALVRLGSERLRLGGCVCALAYSRDGSLLATASNGDDRVVIWAMPAGKRLRQFPVKGGASSFLLFSPDDTRLASLGGHPVDGSFLHVWDVKSGKELFRHGPRRLLPGSHGPGFSADGKCVAAVENGRTVHIWDVATGRELRKLEVNGIIEAFAWVAEDTLLGLIRRDQQLSLWDLGASKKRCAIPISKEGRADMAISPDGDAFALEVAGHAIAVHEAATGRLRHRLTGHTRMIYSLAFAADGKAMVSGSYGGTLRLWDLTHGKQRQRITVGEGGLPVGVLSPDGKTVAGGGPNYAHTVLLWDAATGKPLNPFAGQTSPVSSLAVSPDAKLVATCSWLRGEDLVWLWDAATGRPVRTFAGHRGGTGVVGFSPDGQWLATGGWREDATVRTWAVGTGRALHTLRGHMAGITCLAIAPDGKRIASGDAYCESGNYRGRVLVWDALRGRLLHELHGPPGAVQSLQFTPNGRTLLAANDGVHFWDVESGRYLGALPVGGRIWSLALSADGKILALVDGQGPPQLWEVATRKEIGRLPRHFKGYQASLSPDGRFVAAGTADGLLLYDWVRSEECLRLDGSGRGGATRAMFSPDGKTLLSDIGAHASCLVWDIADVLQRPLGDLKAERADLERWWAELRGDDAGTAYRAAWNLVRARPQALPLLQSVLKPVAVVDGPEVERLIKDLEAPRFETRDRAARELEKRGEAVEGRLRRVLRGKATLEQRRRVEAILKKLGPSPTPERVRALRGVFVLERIGTPEACRLLASLAAGEPEVELTLEAQAALRRLKGGR
jgi:WD40 repeat protein